MKPTLALRSFLLGSIFFSASPMLHATIYYWDDNAIGAGFGTAGASTGTWAAPTTGPTAGWSLSNTGANAFAGFTTGTGDALNFGTAANGLGAGAISVSGSVSTNSITFGSASGAITLSGGTQITLGGTTPTITVNNAQDTISTALINSTNNATSGLTKAGTGELILSGTGNSIAGDANTGNNVGIRLLAGTLTVSGGTLATATAGKGLGTFSGDVGNFKQTGGTVTVNATGDLIVGWNSNSTFTLSGGTTSAANIRHQDAGDGVVTISGTNTTTVGTAYHNTNSTGTDSLTVNLNSGGTLATNSLSMSLGANAQASGNHSLNVNFDGGTLKARSTANLIAATPTGGASTRAINVLVKTNGAVFDSNGFTATVLQPILHDSGGPAIDGGLTLNDTAVTKGTLVLTGANTYTGATTITAGTLQFAKQTSLYNNATASWTAANIKVAGTGTLALNVGGTGEFTTGNVTTLLTNLGGANGTSTTGFAAGSFIGFNTANAAGGTFTVADTLADSTGSGGGAIGVRKLGANTLVLSGLNTYTGATTVSGGFLVLNHLNAIANSASVSVASGTTLQPNLAGTYANTAAVSLTGAGINTGATNFAGALFFGNGANAAAVWNAPITLGGVGTTRITSFGVTMDQTLGGAIGGTGPLELSSRGGLSSSHRATWTLNAASNYTGNTTIVNNDGLQDVTVKLGIADALPTTTSLNLSVIQGAGAPSAVFATLDLNGFSQTLAGLTDTGGNVTTAPGTGNKRVINSSGTLATLTINNAGAVAYGTTGTNITAGTIGGTTADGAAANNLALVKNNVGTLTLSGANTYTGGTTLNQGTLTIGTGGTLGASTGALTVNNTNSTAAGTNAVLNLATAVNTTVGSLSGTIATPTSGTNTATINIASTRTLTVNQTAAGTYAGVIAGAGGFTLGSSSTNTLTLTGTNTYTGATNVAAGTLLINGSTSSTSLVTVDSGATLGGSGTVGGNTTISGIHSPGTSPGIQTFSGNLGYTTGSSLTWELASDAIGLRGTDFDGVNVGGNLDFAGATTINLTFNLPGSTVNWNDTFWDTSHTGTSGWLVYDVTGTTTNFSNLSIAAINWTDGSGQSFNSFLSGSTFALHQDGNDIYLTYTAVPEPGSALLGGIGTLLLLRRRRC